MWWKRLQKTEKIICRTGQNRTSLPSGEHAPSPDLNKSNSQTMWWTTGTTAICRCASLLWVSGLVVGRATLRSRASSRVVLITSTGGVAVASPALKTLLTFYPRSQWATKWLIKGAPSDQRGTPPSMVTPISLPCQTIDRAKQWEVFWDCMVTKMTGVLLVRHLRPILKKRAFSWGSPSHSPDPKDTTIPMTFLAVKLACFPFLTTNGQSPKRKKAVKGKTA